MRRICVFFFAYLATPIVRSNDPLCAGLPEDQEILFPSPITCTHYFKCYNGIFSEERCPDGLYFSANNNKCVEPEFAECLGGSGGPPKTTEYPSTTPEVVDTIVPSTTTTPEPAITTEKPTVTTPAPQPSTTPPLEVPTTPSHTDPRCEGDEISYWPHPSECNLYIECYRGDSYEMACPANRYFSNSLKRCVEASESDCCAQNPSKCS